MMRPMSSNISIIDHDSLADASLPIITNDILTESIKVTNQYCLQGIENNNKISSADEDSESDRISGLESVVTVLEEVLIWPTKYPTIFEQSPLRNQAGVLLYGPPGTLMKLLANHFPVQHYSLN